MLIVRLVFRGPGANLVLRVQYKNMWRFLLSHFCLAALAHGSLYLSRYVQTIVLDSKFP